MNVSTRFQKNQGMAIDNILVDSLRFSFCTVLLLANVLSDHDAQCLVLDTFIAKMKVVTYKVRTILITKDKIRHFQSYYLMKPG